MSTFIADMFEADMSRTLESGNNDIQQANKEPIDPNE